MKNAARTLTTGRWSTWSRGDAGIALTGKGLMSYAPIYYAVGRIAGHVGLSRLELRVRDTEGRKSRVAEIGELGVDAVVNEKPNELQTAIVWREQKQMEAIIWGNGRTGILRNRMGEPVELIPLNPETTFTVIIWRENSEGIQLPEKWHITTDSKGNRIKIPDRDVLHILGLGGDGLTGWSLIDLAKNSIGAGLAGEKHVNKTYKNNAIPGLVLEAPEGVFVNDADAEDFIESFNRFHSGIDKVNRVGLLRHGVKATTLSQTGRDSQFIEQRRFAREEAALWTLVESMLGVEKSQSYNSLQQRNQAYLQNCLARWLVKWEQECYRKLLRQLDRDRGYFWKFNTSAILRGSLKERLESYDIARKIGLYSQEEIRDFEDLPDIDPDDNFQNPNTSSKTQPARPAEPTENTDNQLQDVIRNQLERFIGTECNRLLEIAGNGKRFIDRVEDFYQTWQKSLVSLFGSLGAQGAAELTLVYVAESKAQIIAVTNCQPEELLRRIETLTESWPRDRSQQLAAQIKEMNNAT